MIEPINPLRPKGTKSPYIPEKVAPMNGAIVMRSSSLKDINQLAMAIRGLNESGQLCLITAIMDLGLMRSFSLAFAARMLQKRFKSTSYQAWARVFEARRSNGVIKSMLDNTIRHMLHGKDREESHSIGGFSSRELQTIANLVAIASQGNTGTTES